MVDFHPTHRAMLERWAASGCAVSRYMLDHKVWFPEALEALHRERCREPVPVADDDDQQQTKHGEIDDDGTCAPAGSAAR